MIKTTIKKWATFLSIVEVLWSVFGYFQALLTGPLKLIGPLEIHPPIFLLLAMLGFGFVIAINWKWIQKKLPSQKFRALSPKIDECLDVATLQRSKLIIYKDLKNSPPPPNVYNKLKGLSLELQILRIKSPVINQSDADYLGVWFDFLIELAHHARHGDLRRAREINIPTVPDK